MEEIYVLSYEEKQACIKYGKDYSDWLHEDPARMKYTYRGIDAQPDKLAAAKMGECIFGKRMGWFAAINFDGRRGPEKGGDFVTRGTLPFRRSQRRIYPYRDQANNLVWVAVDLFKD
jgi:hypothetical protein